MDPFALHPENLGSPCGKLAEVIPSDTIDLPVPCRGLWVGGQGALKVTSLAGNIVTLTGAIGILPIRVTRVWATGTSATGIVALW